MGYDPEAIFNNFDETQISNHFSDLFEMNLIKMPPYFNLYYKNLCGLQHLNTLYSESYWSICFGFYNSGISAMSLLIEVTLREIIRVHTGRDHQKTYEALLKIASENHSEIEDKNPIIHPFVLNILKGIKDQIRNPYHHCNFDTLFKNKTIRLSPIHSISQPENILESIKKDIDDINNGVIHCSEVPANIDPCMAAILKLELDEKRAFDLAWEIYPFFWFLVDEYLNKEQTQASLKKFGSPYEKYFKKE